MGRRSLTYVLFGIAIAAAPGFAAEHYVGVAYARSGQIAYREEHWIYEVNGVPTRLVLYRCASGQPFARKLVKNVPDAFAPDFDFVDGRDGYREGVRSRDGAREVYVQKGALLPLRTTPLPFQEGAVIDAGFDAYVGRHWVELVRQHDLKVPFLVPGRFAYLDLKLSGVSKSVVDGEPAMNLSMTVNAWFGFAVPSIDLTYLTVALGYDVSRESATFTTAQARTRAYVSSFLRPCSSPPRYKMTLMLPPRCHWSGAVRPELAKSHDTHASLRSRRTYK